ncbi:hypothetical protein [Vitiosangium sp. GDMCC 1.1324]|uniref:hypothetical protein n=1 Tax=Vitiosangium sp. (strain GDMCC 1.1324) TaxID=2138576 RepID=UPI000D385774|nr:hypothetical protein [Vitiosangium sp. GDMCC 1.1324]PTL78455.1 hypothetical protein DAT35_38640 [Vitiosangium sp. GDMCC 1.1324]
MGPIGKRAARLARWGAVWLGTLALACGPLPEDEPDAEGLPLEAQADGMESRAPEAQLSGISGPFDVSKPVLEAQRTGFTGPSVAFDGEVYLVVWEDSRTGRVFGARVKPDGRILDPAGIPLNLTTGLSGGQPRVAYDGTQFVVVWVSSDGILGAHVEGDGDVRRHLTLGFSDEIGGPPGIACTKKLCLVAYTVSGDDENVVVAARVDSRGKVLERQSLSPGFNNAFDPAVAWDGKQFLVVWSDERGGDGGDIFGNRVRKDGTVLDGRGVPLITAPAGQVNPDVTWTGERFLVVWEDSRGGEPDIFGARVRRDLSVEEPTGFPIAAHPGAQSAPRLAHDDCESLVVWSDTRKEDFLIRGARVSDDGEVLDPSGFSLPSSGDFPKVSAPAVASNGNHYFVTFSDEAAGADPFSTVSHILGTRVKHDTTVQDSPPLLFTRSATAQTLAASAYGDGQYLVVWRETRAGEKERLLATRVRTDGRVLGPPFQLPTGLNPGTVSVAFNGSTFLVVWDEDVSPDTFDRDIRGARVSSAGVLLDASSLPIAALDDIQSNPAVAASGAGFLVVWEDGRTSGEFGNVTDIFGTRVSATGGVLDPGGFLIAGTLVTEETPSVIQAGDHSFVSWVHFDFTKFDTETSIRGARVSESGTVLDSPGLLIGPGPALSEAPALSFDGTNVLVAWAEGSFEAGWRISAARVSASGALLDATPITVSAGEAFRMRPTATFDGSDHWLVWEENGSFIPENEPVDVHGARIRPDGSVRDPGGRPIARHDEPEYNPIVVSNGAGRAAVFYTEFVTKEDVMNTRVQGRKLTGSSLSATREEEPREEASH